MISRRKFGVSLAAFGAVGVGIVAQRFDAGYALAGNGAFSNKPFAIASPQAAKLIAAAESQVGKTVEYDGAYVGLKYPMGDIPLRTGVCSDVVVRAYRDAFGVDLQKDIHEDMKRAFGKYPKIWGLKRPDKNIDHRRVPNMERYFARKNAKLDIGTSGGDFQPGDLVSQRLLGNLPHIAVVSHYASRDGKRPLIIHNIGSGTRIEDRLFEFKIVGHFRYFPNQG